MKKDEQITEKISLKDSSSIKSAILFSSVKFSVLNPKDNTKISNFHSKKYYQQIIELKDDVTQEEVTAEIVEKSEETVNKQRSKKKRWVNVVFLIVNLGIVIGILLWNFLGNTDQMSLSDLLTRQINWWWLLVGLGLFILSFLADSSRIFTMILFSTKRPRPFLSYKSVAMCRFYDSITPLSTGGQPFQIFYLNKRGLPAATATSVPIAKYLYSQFYGIIFVSIVLICQHLYIVTLNPFILTCCYVGFGLNALLLFSILFLSSSKKVAPAFAVGILKLLAKMHIVKDYRKSFVKVMHTVRDYVTTMRQFISNFWIALSMLILTGLFLVVNYTIPFIVYATFMPLDSNWLSIWLELFTIAVVCDMACSFIPLPGATGMAEVSFAVLFASFFVTTDGYNIAVWALLLWRIYTYYGVLLQGLLIMFYDFLVGNRKIAPLLARFKKEDLAKEQKEKEPIVRVVKSRGK